jgi:hypothetical protein
MQNRTGVASTGVIGAIVIILSVGGFFLLIQEMTVLYGWALAFLLLSEIALFAGLIGIRFAGRSHGSVFMHSGITTALSLYFVVTLISVFCVNIFEGKVNGFIFMELCITAVFVIVVIVTLVFSRRTAISDERVVNARGFMGDCERRLHDLLANPRNKEYVQPLSAVYESVKYSDKIGASALDGMIDSALAKMEAALSNEQGSAKYIMASLDEFAALMKRRKADMGTSKRGGF